MNFSNPLSQGVDRLIFVLHMKFYSKIVKSQKSMTIYKTIPTTITGVKQTFCLYFSSIEYKKFCLSLRFVTRRTLVFTNIFLYILCVSHRARCSKPKKKTFYLVYRRIVIRAEMAHQKTCLYMMGITRP